MRVVLAVAELGIRFSCVQVRPNQMEALAEGLALSEWQSSDPMGAFPPRKGADVIRAVLEGQEDDISILEWANLFAEPEWPETEGCSTDDVCFEIFRALVKRKPVANLLLFRAALFLNGGAYFSGVLLSKIHLCSGTLTGPHALALELIVDARESDFSSIAQESMTQSVTPSGLFARAGLGACRQLIRNTVDAVIRLAKSPVLFEFNHWFATIYEQLGRPDQAILTEAIASHGVDRLARETALLQPLKSTCDPSIETSLWYELGEDTLKVLSSLLKVTQYFKIRGLSKNLEEAEALELPGMTEATQKNIRSRTLFWSNYTTRLLSVRVLLPQTTADYLKARGALSYWCEQMTDGDSSEVLILEFDKVLIVEVLRGPSTEMRIFLKTHRSCHLLQQGHINSPDEIRRMYQDDEHDHLVAWQWSAEKLLRTEYGIQVDDEVTWFRGLSEQAGAYKRKKGLPDPATDVLSQRNHDLEHWWKAFLKQEEKLGKYGKDNGSSFGSSTGSSQDGSQSDTQTNTDRHRILAQARHLKRTGKKRLWRDALEGEARKGDVLALFLLVEDLLLSGRGSHEERIRGEHWYGKLKDKANAGDTAAQEMLKKIK